MDAFDADVVIYASKGDPRGDLLSRAIETTPDDIIGIGSVLLLAETLVPDPHDARLAAVLARIGLIPVGRELATMAADLRTTYRLKTPDAIHLATAIVAGAERFVTNNRRDFTDRIGEIDVVHPWQR